MSKYQVQFWKYFFPRLIWQLRVTSNQGYPPGSVLLPCRGWLRLWQDILILTGALCDSLTSDLIYIRPAANLISADLQEQTMSDPSPPSWRTNLSTPADMKVSGESLTYDENNKWSLQTIQHMWTGLCWIFTFCEKTPDLVQPAPACSIVTNISLCWPEPAD